MCAVHVQLYVTFLNKYFHFERHYIRHNVGALHSQMKGNRFVDKNFNNPWETVHERIDLNL